MAVNPRKNENKFGRFFARLFEERADGEVPILLFISLIIVAIFFASMFLEKTTEEKQAIVATTYVCCPNSDDCHLLSGIPVDTNDPQQIIEFIDNLCRGNVNESG